MLRGADGASRRGVEEVQRSRPIASVGVASGDGVGQAAAPRVSQEGCRRLLCPGTALLLHYCITV